MLRLLSGFRIVLSASFLGVLVSVRAYAVVPFTTTPFTPGTTSSYGFSSYDYLSVPEGTGNLAAVNTAQGGAAPTGNLPTGAPNTHIGLAEAFTPRTGSTYGAPNNHAFQLRNIVMPLGGAGGANMTVTLRVLQPTFTGGGLNASDSAFPIAATQLFSDTFTWNNTAGNVLARFDLGATGPSLALDTSYAIALEWDVAAPVTENSLLWYRLPSNVPVDGTTASGQGYRFRDFSVGYQTIAATGGAGGAPRTYAVALNAVPEPGTVLLAGLGIPALAWAAWKRGRRAAY